MAWEPKINVFDERQAKANLIVYAKLVQSDALTWANGGAAGLTPFKRFHKSPRKVAVYPSWTFMQTGHRAQFIGDFLIVDFETTVEVAILNGKQDTLSDLSTKYSMAVESMLMNVPETTFNENSIIETTTTPEEINTVFDVQGRFKTEFIQVFQTRAKWRIEASATN